MECGFQYLESTCTLDFVGFHQYLPSDLCKFWKYEGVNICNPGVCAICANCLLGLELARAGVLIGWAR